MTGSDASETLGTSAFRGPYFYRQAFRKAEILGVRIE